MNHSEIVSFLWGVADLIRDTFKRGKYQDIILPLTVLRRLDCVLADNKEKVLGKQAELRNRKLENLDPQLRKVAGFAFYNTSRYDFEKLLQDAPHLAANLRNYIAGFSPNMREVLEKFDFDNTISKLDEAGLLFQVLERFKNVDLHPDKVDNPTMGTIFEELIRKFNEALNENPGEHFTPRDVVHLMVDLMLAGDETEIRAKKGDPHRVRSLLRVGRHAADHQGTHHGRRAEERRSAPPRDQQQRRDPPLRTGSEPGDLGGLEVRSLHEGPHRPRCGQHHLRKHPLQRPPRRQDLRLPDRESPYGKDWKRDLDAVRAEHERGAAGRFGPGLPRISDGQLLFLLHMLARAKDPMEGGSRVAIIMNGSPLFTGDAGSGESEIRRFILENDLLEALIALPEQLFYNTGIATYIWVVTNRKAPERHGKVQLIDASHFDRDTKTGIFCALMRKSLGDKRREIPFARARDILKILADLHDGDTRTITKDGKEEEVVVSRVFPTTHFGFRKITVERPLRLNFRASPERTARLEQQKGFQRLAESRKRGTAGAKEEAEGHALQEAIRKLVHGLPSTIVKDREEFERLLDGAANKAGLKLPAPARKAVLAALSERDETAAICRDSQGDPESDPELRDTESVPLPTGDDPVDAEDIPASVRAFFDREVKPHVPDAWIETSKRDPKDGRVGLVGYEINFNRYFYRYTPPRPLDEIEADIRGIEGDIVRMLAEVTGSPAGGK